MVLLIQLTAFSPPIKQALNILNPHTYADIVHNTNTCLGSTHTPMFLQYLVTSKEFSFTTPDGVGEPASNATTIVGFL